MEEELIQTEYKALRWEPYVRSAAYWLLMVLCASPLIATVVLMFGSAATDQFTYALIDAYLFHLRFNFALGVVAFLILVAWVVNRFCLFGTGAFSELLEQKWAIPLLLMIVWVATATALNCSGFGSAFFGDESRLEGIMSMLCYAGFALCALLIDDEDRRRMLLLAFCAISAVIGVLYFAQIAGIGVLGKLTSSGFCVIFGQMNHHGYYLALGIAATAGLLVYEENVGLKVACGVVIALLSACLIMNGSLGPFLAAAFALVFLAVIALIHGGKANLIALIPLAVFLCVSLGNMAGVDYKASLSGLGQVGVAQAAPAQEEPAAEESAPAGEAPAAEAPVQEEAAAESAPAQEQPQPVASTTGNNLSSLIQDIQKILSGSADVGTAGTGRMALWIGSVKLIGESPVFGYGMENSGPKLYDLVRTDSDRSHNEILQWGLHGGVPAMLLYVAGLVMLAVRQLRHLRKLDAAGVIAIDCVAGYLCSSLFGCMMISITPYFWMFIGLAAWLPYEVEKQ